MDRISLNFILACVLLGGMNTIMDVTWLAILLSGQLICMTIDYRLKKMVDNFK